MAAALVLAVLVLLPPLSVVAARVMARKLRALARSQLASFRYMKMKGGGGQQLPPVALYSRSRRSSEEEEEEEEECMLCLTGIEEGSEVRELRCRHLFHRACLDRWLRARSVAATCPLCRGRLLLLEDDDEEEEEEAAAVEDDDEEALAAACTWLWPS